MKFHEKYLNSCEGKDYVRRKLKCITTLIRPKPFFETFSLLVRVGSFKLLFVRQGNAGRKWYQDVIWLLPKQRIINLPKIFKFSS